MEITDCNVEKEPCRGDREALFFKNQVYLSLRIAIMEILLLLFF